MLPYKLTAPRKGLFGTPFVSRILTPRSRKSGFGSAIKTFFGYVREKNWPKPGRIFAVCSNHRSQSIGRGRISREGALDVRESRERRDKIVPYLSPKKRKNAILASKIYVHYFYFNFFWQNHLLFTRESRSARQTFRQKGKTAKDKKKQEKMCLRFFSKV